MESTEFFILLFIHLIGLVLGFGSVMVTDLFGLLWVFDRVRFAHLIRVSGTNENFIWIGWGILVCAGIPLAYLKGTIDNLMVIKLFFVALIGLNGIPLYFLHKKLENYNVVDNVPGITIFRLTLALAISQLGWWGAVVIGFLHRHVQTIINWPEYPYFVCSVILGTLLSILAIGEIVFRLRKN